MREKRRQMIWKKIKVSDASDAQGGLKQTSRKLEVGKKGKTKKESKVKENVEVKNHAVKKGPKGCKEAKANLQGFI